MKYFIEKELITVEAATPAKLFTEFKGGRFTSDHMNVEYREGFAAQFRDLFGGEPPRTHTPKYLIADLVAQS